MNKKTEQKDQKEKRKKEIRICEKMITNRKKIF